MTRITGREIFTTCHHTVSILSGDLTGSKIISLFAKRSVQKPANSGHALGASLSLSNLRLIGGKIPSKIGTRSLQTTMHLFKIRSSLTSQASTRYPSPCLLVPMITPAHMPLQSRQHRSLAIWSHISNQSKEWTMSGIRPPMMTGSLIS